MGEHFDHTKVRKANQGLLFRLLAAAFVLYQFVDILLAYFRGGSDAPSPVLLLVAAAVLGGGGIFILILGITAWKKERENARMTDEEVAEMEALREEDA